MVEIRGVEKSYADRKVLRGINLKLQSGQVTALVGPNGAGKSTLLKCVLGLVIPQKGEILIDQVATGEDPAYRRKIGYMAQAARFPEHLTIHELVEMVSDVRQRPPRSLSALIRLLELQGSEDRRFGTLSGGTRQKVNALLSLAFDPDIYILDEPTANLDPLVSRRLKDLILSLKKDGKLVIVSSHHVADLEDLADRIVFMLEGEIRFDGSARDLEIFTDERRLERSVAKLMEKIE